MTGHFFRDLPSREAGCVMPSAHTIENGDYRRRLEAEIGSRRLLEALHRLFLKGDENDRTVKG